MIALTSDMGMFADPTRAALARTRSNATLAFAPRIDRNFFINLMISHPSVAPLCLRQNDSPITKSSAHLLRPNVTPHRIPNPPQVKNTVPAIGGRCGLFQLQENGSRCHHWLIKRLQFDPETSLIFHPCA